MQGAKALAAVIAKEAAKEAGTDKKRYVLVDVDSPPGSPVAGPVVKTAPLADEKAVAVLGAARPMMHLARQVMAKKNRGKKGGGGIQSFRTRLCQRFNGTGSSATFYAPVVVLAPNGSGVTEAANFASLFDTARCNGVDIYVKPSSTAAILNMGAWGFAFDPANNGAYASVVGLMIADQRVGPMAFSETASNVAPLVMSPTGYIHKHFRTMRQSPTAGAVGPSELVGSEWFACSDTGAVAGFIKMAFDAVTGQSVSYDMFVVYHMEYKSRT